LVEVAGQADESALRSIADLAAVPSRVGLTGSVLTAIPAEEEEEEHNKQQ